MTVTRDGRPLATIVIPDEATSSERFAAEELRDYVEAISGAQLGIAAEGAAAQGARVLVGRTEPASSALAELGDDESEAFVVRADGEALILAGASDRGTLYAVYDLLEQDLGCRWLGPGPEWEEIPSRPSIEVGEIDRVERPAMKYRFLRMTIPAERGDFYADCLSWAVKNRVNIGAGWPPTRLPESFARRGGFRAWMNPHVLHNILDPEEHFDEHPEWYALRGGRRQRAERGGFQQVCTTNPEVVEAMAHGLGEMFDARPDVDFMGLGQGDGTAFCQCPRCVALDSGEIWPGPSGTGERQLPVITERWLSFVNDVARRLQSTHPGKKVYTLAYHQTFRPPDPEVIRPEPNVMVQVVNSRPNYVCFVHRFEAEDCPHHQRFREGIERWVEITPGGVMVYEYNPHSTFCCMPYPAPYKFADDISYLDRIGVVGYEGQSSPNIWGTYGINHYVIAKATWQGRVDARELVRDYCDHAFGAASGAMQRFYEAADRALAAAEHITRGVWSWMTPEAMAECRRHLDAAHAAAVRDVVKARLREIEIGFHYGELGAEAYRTAQRAEREDDPELMAQAVETAEAAAQYLADEGETQPHHAAVVGKLSSVWLKRWRRELERMRAQDLPDADEALRTLPETWRFALDPEDVGVEERWFAPDFDDGGWDEISVTTHWEDQGYEGYDGYAWYRVPVTLTAEELSEPLLLAFEGVDAEAWVYVGGELIGHHVGWDVPFAVELPVNWLEAGQQTLIAVRVFDTSNKGGMYGPVSVARPR
ncbi:MAG: DUF4838 domain-containing protein [Armatimonadota bacterium]